MINLMRTLGYLMVLLLVMSLIVLLFRETRSGIEDRRGQRESEKDRATDAVEHDGEIAALDGLPAEACPFVQGRYASDEWRYEAWKRGWGKGFRKLKGKK